MTHIDILRRRHREACARHAEYAKQYADALLSGNRYAQDVSYQDVQEAYREANELFCQIAKHGADSMLEFLETLTETLKAKKP